MYRRMCACVDELLAKVTEGVVHGVYASVNLCNQEIHKFPEHF